MLNFLTSPVGRLRLLGLAEGSSLLLLIGVAVPLKHLRGDSSLVHVLGPLHGLLFLLYLLNAVRVGTEQHWRFAQTTWKVLLASLVPFGTFYIERRVLAPLQESPQAAVEVLVFKTSVTHENQVEQLRSGLDALGRWSFDLSDCDHAWRPRGRPPWLSSSWPATALRAQSLPKQARDAAPPAGSLVATPYSPITFLLNSHPCLAG